MGFGSAGQLPPHAVRDPGSSISCSTILEATVLFPSSLQRRAERYTHGGLLWALPGCKTHCFCSHCIENNLVTWPHLTSEEARKCTPSCTQGKQMEFQEQPPVFTTSCFTLDLNVWQDNSLDLVLDCVCLDSFWSFASPYVLIRCSFCVL